VAARWNVPITLIFIGPQFFTKWAIDCKKDEFIFFIKHQMGACQPKRPDLQSTNPTSPAAANAQDSIGDLPLDNGPTKMPRGILRRQAAPQKRIYSDIVRVGRHWVKRQRIFDGPVYLNPEHNCEGFKLRGRLVRAAIIGERQVNCTITGETHIWVFPECKQIMEVFGYDNRFIVEDLDMIRVYDVSSDMGLRQILRAETKETIRLITDDCIVTAPADRLNHYTVWHHRRE
jgi:hypothetical protein